MIYKKGKEKVDSEDGFDYVMEKLFEDKEEGLLSEFEENFGKDIVDWYFSNWIEEEEVVDIDEDFENQSILEDMRYEDSLNQKWEEEYAG